MNSQASLQIQSRKLDLNLNFFYFHFPQLRGSCLKLIQIIRQDQVQLITSDALLLSSLLGVQTLVVRIVNR
jgi:hypothetical protein